jgi:hypothetical protein
MFLHIAVRRIYKEPHLHSWRNQGTHNYDRLDIVSARVLVFLSDVTSFFYYD